MSSAALFVKVSVRALEDADEWQAEEMASQVFICSGNALTNTVAALQCSLSWWKLDVSF